MFLVRMLVDMLNYRLCRCTLQFRYLRYANNLRRSNLLAAVHTRSLVEAMWEAEGATLVDDNIRRLKRVVRPAVAGVSSGVTHSY